MSRHFRVRFAPAKIAADPDPGTDSRALARVNPVQQQPGHRVVKSSPSSRSRVGCRECKRRRVKCDEHYPVCGACERRGSVCESVPRLRQWQVESPWLRGSNTSQDRAEHPVAAAAVAVPIPIHTTADKNLVRYWLEKASQIMVMDPDINPLSFPLLDHVDRCPHLFHVIQSVSAAHQIFFHPSKLTKCLEERTLALRLVREELSRSLTDLFPSFITIFLLGLSTAWTDSSHADIGYEHLFGARALVNMLLSSTSPSGAKSPFQDFIVGSYVYWEMAYAFLVPSAKQNQLNTEAMYDAVSTASASYHPIGGYSLEIFYFLGNLGRYCRLVLDTGVRDTVLEATFEEQLTAWEPNRDSRELGSISDAFRYHGLINLEALCSRRLTTEEELRLESDRRIQHYAQTTVRILDEIPISHPCTNLQGIPLFTAGSELRAEDREAREQVRKRFNALYSLNHLRANLTAVSLLEELWAMRDKGQVITWLELMLQKECLVMLG